MCGTHCCWAHLLVWKSPCSYCSEDRSHHLHLGLGNGISDISVIAVQWYEYLPRRAWMRSGVGWFADEAKGWRVWRRDDE
jgi:hypothetical protein